MIRQFYRLGADETGLSPGYVYAISRDCYPIFADDDSELYDSCFEIQKAKISAFVKEIDDLWLADKPPTFYGLEDQRGGKSARSDLIVMLRYCALEQRFAGRNFWETLESEAPIEGKNFLRPFDLWEA